MKATKLDKYQSNFDCAFNAFRMDPEKELSSQTIIPVLLTKNPQTEMFLSFIFIFVLSKTLKICL